MNDDLSYICGNCGEEIVIPFDHSQGNRQEYVEDCPVCCHPNLIRIEVEAEGHITISSELE